MLTPTAVMSLGIDPVHFGVVMVTGLVVGLATPPVGACLFVVSGVAKRPMQKFVPKLIPFLITCLLGYLIVIVCPALATFLPGLMN
jgi:TRAP-type C4-dicarboxylate transport system permease large subunit